MTLETGVRNLASRLDGSPTVVFQIRPGLLTNVKFLGFNVSQVGTPLEILKYTRRVPWVSACLWVTFVRLSDVSCKRGKLGLSTIYTQSSIIYTIFGLSSIVMMFIHTFLHRVWTTTLELSFQPLLLTPTPIPRPFHQPTALKNKSIPNRWSLPSFHLNTSQIVLPFLEFCFRRLIASSSLVLCASIGLSKDIVWSLKVTSLKDGGSWVTRAHPGYHFGDLQSYFATQECLTWLTRCQIRELGLYQVATLKVSESADRGNYSVLFLQVRHVDVHFLRYLCNSVSTDY